MQVLCYYNIIMGEMSGMEPSAHMLGSRVRTANDQSHIMRWSSQGTEPPQH